MIITQSRVLFQLLLWYCRPWVTPLYISGHNCSSENSCFWGCNGYLQFFVCAASIPLFFSNQIPFREFPSLVECAILKGLPCPWLGDDHMTRAWPITCSFLVIWLLKSGLCKTKADNNFSRQRHSETNLRTWSCEGPGLSAFLDFSIKFSSVQFGSVAQLCPTLCDPMNCSMPGFLSVTKSQSFSNSWPQSQSCHPTISSSVVPFSSHLQSFPASGSFPRSQFFALRG